MRATLIILTFAYVLSQFYRAFLAVLAAPLQADIGATAAQLLALKRSGGGSTETGLEAGVGQVVQSNSNAYKDYSTTSFWFSAPDGDASTSVS